MNRWQCRSVYDHTCHNTVELQDKASTYLELFSVILAFVVVFTVDLEMKVCCVESRAVSIHDI